MESNLPATKEELNFFQRLRLNRVIKRLDNGKEVKMWKQPDYIKKNDKFLSVYAEKGDISGLGSIDDYAILAPYSTRLLEEACHGKIGNPDSFDFMKAVFEKKPEVLSQIIAANSDVTGNNFNNVRELLKQNNYELLKAYPQVIKQLIESGLIEYTSNSDIINLLKENPEMFEVIYPKEQSIWDKPNPPYSMDRFEEKKHHDAMQEWFRRNFEDLPENQRNEYLKYADIATQIYLFDKYPEVYPNIKEEAILQKAKREHDENYCKGTEGFKVPFAKDFDSSHIRGLYAIPSIMKFLPNDTQLKLLKINQDYLDLASKEAKEIYANGNPLLGAVVEDKSFEDTEEDFSKYDIDTFTEAYPEMAEEYNRFCDLIAPAFLDIQNPYAVGTRNQLFQKNLEAFYPSRDLVHSLDEEPTLSKLKSEKQGLTPEENVILAEKRAEMLALAVFDRVSDGAYKGTRKVESSGLPFPKTLDELENYAQKRQEFYREAVDKVTEPETVAQLITDCYSRQVEQRSFDNPKLGNISLKYKDIKELKKIFKKLDSKLQPGQSFEELSNNDKDKIFYGEDKER